MKLNLIIFSIFLLSVVGIYGKSTRTTKSKAVAQSSTAKTQNTIASYYDHMRSYIQKKAQNTTNYIKPYSMRIQNYIKKNDLDIKAKKAQIILFGLSTAALGAASACSYEVYQQRKNAVTIDMWTDAETTDYFLQNECDRRLAQLRKLIFISLICTAVSGYTTYFTISSSIKK